ncbi:hypothetical protein VZ94_08560 [Methylocucumis oryzae]|uniref:Filamentous haemagglutinin FhaB/tRNA nuclease CdiA-like TPS domain-containing protein n=1 Tax=Methylocucumis oryzae TaxID=1632867 RepID=A0A0F3IK09_9GAMM|nr:hypothetical protein VZ94_08560 [Methylocucumis oryzae]
MTTESVRYALEHGTDVKITADTKKTDSANGNLQVVSDLAKRSGGDAQLTLSADNDITVDSAIRASSGRLAVTVKADNDGNGTGSTVVNKALDLNSGELTLKGTAKLTKASAVRRANIVIDSAEVDVASALSDIDLITVNSGSALTLSRDYAGFKGSIENSGLLTVNRLLQIHSLTLNDGTLAGNGKVRVTQAFNFAQGHVTGEGELITANTATTTLATKGAAYLDKHWFNYGKVNWTGANALASETGNGQWTNGVRSVLNLGDASASPELALNLERFNNAGVVNVLGGHLKISASGNDDGRYEVAEQAFLSFLGGERTFRAHSVINSDQVLSFANGQTLFQRGAELNIDELELSSFGSLTLRTGNLLSLNTLTINTGSLSGNDSITVADQLNFHAGSLNTYGLLTTAANTRTTLADAGNVSLGSRLE